MNVLNNRRTRVKHTACLLDPLNWGAGPGLLRGSMYTFMSNNFIHSFIHSFIHITCHLAGWCADICSQDKCSQDKCSQH